MAFKLNKNKSIYRKNSKTITIKDGSVLSDEILQAQAKIIKLDNPNIVDSIELDTYFISDNELTFCGTFNLPFIDKYKSGYLILIGNIFIVLSANCLHSVVLDNKGNVIRSKALVLNNGCINEKIIRNLAIKLYKITKGTN